MSTEMDEMAGTKPQKEHEWLKNLVGEWRTEGEMIMGPDAPPQMATGHETVRMLGDLWVVGEGTSKLPGGEEMQSMNGLGYDVSFKGYKAFWIASMSSHLWKSDCELSSDGKKMTMNCVGPDMVVDGKTANYRDVIELIDDNHRTLTSFGQDENGEWQQFMKVDYFRV